MMMTVRLEALEVADAGLVDARDRELAGGGVPGMDGANGGRHDRAPDRAAVVVLDGVAGRERAAGGPVAGREEAPELAVQVVAHGVLHQARVDREGVLAGYQLL